MTLRRWYFVAAVALVAALTSALAQAASPRARRLVAGSPPPMSYGRWLMGRGPVAPFTAEVVYRTPEAPTRLQTVGATPAPQAGVRNYLILVMKYLYWHPDVEVALATYINDVENEGLTVELIQLDGGTHWGLRDLLVSKHAELPNLEGCFFIGYSPPYWFYEEGDGPFPCELYYMDLDGEWIDSDGNGVGDLHTAGSGDEGPEIYCGRLVGHRLDLEPGQDERSLIIRYLNKVHDYRQGLATSNGRACLYVDDPWRWWTDQYAAEIAQAWPDMDIYDDPYETIASDYLTKIQIPYEHLRVNVHFGAYGHGFGIPDEAHGGDVRPQDLVDDPPEVLFYHLYCCVAGLWTADDIIGLWYIMTGEGLGVFASTKSGGVNNATEFYAPIAQYYPMGYAVQHWFDSFAPYSHDERAWTMGMLWLGDPTLVRPRVAPSAFELLSPPDGSQFAGPDVLFEWMASIPAGHDETVTYTLTIDNSPGFFAPEVVVEGITDAQFLLTSFDDLVGLTQYWRVVARTNFGKSTASLGTGTFSAAIDSDHDGMADDWESVNGLDPGDPSDAMHDADGDRLLNREEYELDADPRHAESPAFVYADDDHAGDPLQDGTAAHPYGTIQAAIDAATPPAVVRVLPGTYLEAVVVANGIWLVGSGPAVTTINSQNTDEAVFLNGVNNGLVADFTLTAGGTGYTALRSVNSALTVRHCVAVGSRSGFGAGQTGGATFINCLAAGNAYQGIWQDGGANLIVVNSTVCGNADNGVVRWGAGTTTITNSIFWANGDDLALGGSGSVSVSQCDIGDGDYAGWNGNFSADPLFVTGPDHDYYLSETDAGQPTDSPCIDAGADQAWDLGLDRMTTRTDGTCDTGTVDIGYHAAYALSIGSITHSSDVTIYWNAQPGLEYVVEWSEDRQAWNEVDVGAASSWADTNTAGYARKFYRVREK